MLEQIRENVWKMAAWFQWAGRIREGWKIGTSVIPWENILTFWQYLKIRLVQITNKSGLTEPNIT